jgi:hypothetical protein
LHNLHGVLRSESRFAQTESIKIAPLTLRHRRVRLMLGWAATLNDVFLIFWTLMMKYHLKPLTRFLNIAPV